MKTSKIDKKIKKCKKTNAQRRFTATLLGLTILLLAQISLVSAGVFEGLKLYYPFDDAQEKISGFTNLVQNEGTVVYNDTNCKSGKCIHLSPDNNVFIPINNFSAFNSSSSINYWVRFQNATPPASDEFVMLSPVNATVGNIAGRISLWTPTQWNFNGWVASGNQVSGVTPPSQGSYFMITITRTEEGNVTTYVNGVIEKSGTAGIVNITGYKSWILGANFNNQSEMTGELDEMGFWNRTLNQTDIDNLYNEGEGFPYGQVVLEYPNSDGTTFSPIGYNSTIFLYSGQELINATLYVWYANNTLYKTNFTTLSGTSSTALNLSLAQGSIGSYKWNVFVNILNSSSGVETLSSSTNASYFYGFEENSLNFNSTTYETSRETFTLNITYNSALHTLTNPTFNYGGNLYSATLSGTGNNRLITSTIDVPTSTGNKNFWFNFTLGGTQTGTSVNSQIVNGIQFGICNSTLNIPYVNFTYKDEATLSSLSGSIPSSTFSYWIGSGAVNKTYSYINTTVNNSHAFCFSPSDKIINLNYLLQYSATDYPQRTINPTTTTYNNLTTNKILYLLGTGDGLYVTFQVINAAEQPLEGVNSNISLQSGALVGSGTTGSSGGITYWIDPDTAHTACFYLNPYPLYCTTDTFTQTSYTITLGSTGSSNVSDYHSGISYSILPNKNYLSNDTTYSFNFTLSSSYWALESWGFNITNSSGAVISSQSSILSGGGTLNVDLNTGTNSTFIMNYFWIINGTTTSASRSWIILDLDDSSFSIANFISDFKAYIASGFFGLDNFGLGIIVFIVILAVTGTLKVKYGITDEAVLIGVVFSLVALFDVGFNLIPNPVSAVPHFTTILMGLIFSGFLWKEVFQ